MLTVDTTKFFENYRVQFDNLSNEQEEGLKAILEAFSQDPQLQDHRQAAYMLATTYHETARTFKPITEYGKQSYFSKYDGRYGNTRSGDGYRYRGRGYVQLTFRANYRKASEKLSRLTYRYPNGVDLESDPDLTLNPRIAADIMLLGMREGWFTGKNLGQYIQGDKKDYYNARRIINALDKAEDISRYAEKFEAVFNNAIVSANAEAPRTLWATEATANNAGNQRPKNTLW
ncbi:MAG: hypothetical protein BWK78_08740 [Thiotrichaceae bacterium IS1]|nr:MAG: hypothetical protein BWK78_08740 [Thiotrichaceae bacterium IS1]